MSKHDHKAVRRRRPTPTQGRALEITGRAIEYLIDSHVIYQSANGSKDDMEAAQILMKANMAIFEECEEVVPLRQRLWRRLLSFIGVREKIDMLPNEKEAPK